MTAADCARSEVPSSSRPGCFSVMDRVVVTDLAEVHRVAQYSEDRQCGPKCQSQILVLSGPRNLGAADRKWVKQRDFEGHVAVSKRAHDRGRHDVRWLGAPMSMATCRARSGGCDLAVDYGGMSTGAVWSERVAAATSGRAPYRSPVSYASSRASPAEPLALGRLSFEASPPRSPRPSDLQHPHRERQCRPQRASHSRDLGAGRA